MTSTSTVSALEGLNVTCMTAHPDNVKFVSSKLHNSWEKCQCHPLVLNCDYEKDETLCFTLKIKVYVYSTKTWRQENNEAQLLLSHIKPNKGISSSTVSRWINRFGL